MNAGQKLILKICALIILAMMIYPPYQLLGRGMGYHFVFTGADHRQATIDGGLLLVQWVGVCLIGGIAYLLARGADASEHDMLSQPGIRLAVGPQTVKPAPRQIQRAAYPARRYPGEARFQKRTAHR